VILAQIPETLNLPPIGVAPTAVHSLTARLLPSESTKEGRYMIKKVKDGYKVLSEKGKNLGGPYKTKAAAEKRLKQVEYFKHHK
jgi:hypothetical protein